MENGIIQSIRDIEKLYLFSDNPLAPFSASLADQETQITSEASSDISASLQNADGDKTMAASFSPAVLGFGGIDVYGEYFLDSGISLGLNYLQWTQEPYEEDASFEKESCNISGFKPYLRYYLQHYDSSLYFGLGVMFRDIKCEYEPYFDEKYNDSHDLTQLSLELGSRWEWSGVFIDLGAELMPFYRVKSKEEHDRDGALANFFPMLLVSFRLGVY